jgi:gluconolactonase
VLGFDGPWDVLATGLRAPEGPVARADGSVAFVESMASAVSVVRLDGSKATLAATGGGPNGLAARGSELFVANNGGFGHPTKGPGRLQRIAADGLVSTVVGDLDAPNDVCVGADDAVYFTDPRDSWFDDELRPGRIYRWHDSSLTVVHEGIDYPNGIGFDGAGRLVVAESRSGLLRVVEDETAEPWIKCPRGAPDGFCFSADGLCVVCCFDVGEVFVFDNAGDLVETLPTGEDTWPTNCALAADGRLLVTESKQGRLLARHLGLTPLLAVTA